MKILSDIFLFILIFSILLPALIDFFFFPQSSEVKYALTLEGCL